MFSFTEGDIVRADRTTQGLEKDRDYVVVVIHTRVTPFGYFVNYGVVPLITNEGVAGAMDVESLDIVNGHLILTKVGEVAVE